MTPRGDAGDDRPRLDIDIAAASEAPPHTVSDPVPRASGAFGRAVDRLGIVFAGCFVLAMLIIVYEIVARYAFGAPTVWAHETTSFLCAVSFIFGGLYALSRDRHIRVVLIYDAVPPGARRILNVVLSVIGLVTMLFFAVASWQNTANAIFSRDGAFRLETSGSAWNPAYPGLTKLFLFAVIVAMAVQFVVLIVNYARGRGDAARRDPGSGD